MTAREFIEKEALEYKLAEYDEGGFLGIDEHLLEQKLEEYHQVKLKLLGIDDSTNLKIEDCWTACTRIKADKGHLLNKSTEWNNAYQEGFEACFEWLKSAG